MILFLMLIQNPGNSFSIQAPFSGCLWHCFVGKMKQLCGASVEVWVCCFPYCFPLALAVPQVEITLCSLLVSFGGVVAVLVVVEFFSSDFPPVFPRLLHSSVPSPSSIMFLLVVIMFHLSFISMRTLFDEAG
jgi:hypothetical protein